MPEPSHFAVRLHTRQRAPAPPSGARPSPAASTRQPILRPASITQILRPPIHRLVAAKNRRAPPRARKSNGLGSAAVLGRINPTTDLALVSVTQIGPPTLTG
ncbi:MAG: hypothetical protein GX456_12815 [Verrucomicrobia bacterium]|nr:hypothetical protein [Verrucomicrobiota bacterium]